MPDEFDGLTPEQKIERLRGALAAFSQSIKVQGDQITALSARYNVLKVALMVVLQKLARASGAAERFVMDMEKVIADVSDALASREGAVADAYRAEIKEMFESLRKIADPSGSNIKKRH